MAQIIIKEDSGLRTQDSGLRTQDSGLRTQDSGLRTNSVLIYLSVLSRRGGTDR